LHDGVLSVHMHADNAAARDVLQHQLARLRDMLQERGVRTGSLDVGDHSNHSDRAATGNPTSGGPSGQAGRSRPGDGAPTTAAPTPQQAVPVATLTPATDGRLDLHV